MRAGRPGGALDGALDSFDSLENSVSNATDAVTSSTDLGAGAYDQPDIILKVQTKIRQQANAEDPLRFGRLNIGVLAIPSQGEDMSA